jgi:hypothetical protein
VRVTLQNTTKVVTVDGVPARIWEGTTDSGIQVIAFVTRVAVAMDADATEFERELLACESPSIEAAAIPTRLIL